MKSMRVAANREDILRRLEAIRPESQRRWGAMSAHQMICHLADGYRLYMGEKKGETVRLWCPRVFPKWGALWMPFPWPHGFKTMPELEQKQGGGGTRPMEFESDKKELRDLTERFAKLPLDFSWPQHPYFGAMSYGEWMRLAYLHADHHLRQFSA